MTKKKIVRKKKTTIFTRNAGTMTESMFFSKIRSALRNGFRYWKPMQIVLENASRPSQSSNKRLKKEYQCFKCKNWFPRSGVEIDHHEECGSLSCYEDIVPFIQRLTKEELESYNILCKPCHEIKTKKYRDAKKLNKQIDNEKTK